MGVDAHKELNNQPVTRFRFRPLMRRRNRQLRTKNSIKDIKQALGMDIVRGKPVR